VVLALPRLRRRATPRSLLQTAGRALTTADGLQQVLLPAAACAYIVAFAGTGLLRAIYPYPVDGLEPGALQEVRRILDGQPLYVAPQLEYVPFIYGPLAFYLAAPVAAISGSPLAGLRLVSLLASLGSIALLVLLVRRETGRLAIGLLSGGLLAACAPLVDLAMDVGRVDAPALFWLLAAIAVARGAIFSSTATWRHGALAGLLVGLAVLTKQSAAPVGVVLLVLVGLLRPHQLAPFAVALGGSVALAVGLLVAQSGDWPLFYLWELPRRHVIDPQLLPRFWSDVLDRFTLPIVIGPFYLFGRVLAGDQRRAVFYGCVVLGLVGSAWAADATIGGGRNVELDAYTAFALLFGLGLHEVLDRLASAAVSVRQVRAYVLAVALVQFGILLYNPRLVVPYRSDAWDGDRLRETLAARPGPIFAGSYQGYVGPDATAPDLGAVQELEGNFAGSSTRISDAWDQQFAQALIARRFGAVIVDPDNPASSVPILATDYGYWDAGPLFPPGDIYWSWRTGWSPKAELYLPPATP